MRTSIFRFLATAIVLLSLGLASCHKAPHWVTLTWQPPPAVPGVTIKSYNIYRSTTSGGPFVKLASGVTGPPYDDRLVMNDRIYFYVVTAVDQTGRESRFSGEVRARIP
jgi:fibronectin type 3 domain-containing protein